MNSRLARRDDGAALVLALIFLTVISVGILAVVTFADTSFRTTVAVEQQADALYSASSAIDAATTAIRRDVTLGVDPTLPGATACPPSSLTVNGVKTDVTCSGNSGSGAGGGGGGGGTNPSNTPPNAVLTLAPLTGTFAGNPAEDGLVQESNNILNITGRVMSNSTVKVNVAGATLNVFGDVDARGTCDPSVLAVPPGLKTCPDTAAAITNSTDPNYPMVSGHTAQPPAPAPAPAGCPAAPATGQRLVVFQPGSYTSVAALNDVFTRCSGSVFWFRSGFYYFDFADGATTPWNITGSGTYVVGGERGTLWTGNAGDPAPTVPFPVAPAPGVIAVHGACVTSQDDPATPGVQFAFGGTSHLYLKDAKVELCAQGSSTEQQNAIYGLSPVQDTTATPVTGTRAYEASTTSVSAAASAGEPVFQNPNAATPSTADGSTADLTANSKTPANGTTSTLSLSSFAPVTALPAGATITGAKLRIVQQPVNGNVSGLKAVVTPGGGGAPMTINDSQNNCSTSTTSLCRDPATTAYDQMINLPGVNSAAALSGLSVALSATVKETSSGSPKVTVDGVEKVDSVSLTVSYSVPPPTPYRQLSGCLLQTFAAGGCPLIQTVGGPTGFSVHGTVYAPTANLQIELTNVGNQVLERGIICRSAHVKVTGSSTFIGSAIQIPTLSGGGGPSAPRTVTFEARQSGRLVLRAVVTFDDSDPADPGKSANVLSWSVLA